MYRTQRRAWQAVEFKGAHVNQTGFANRQHRIDAVTVLDVVTDLHGEGIVKLMLKSDG